MGESAYFAYSIRDSPFDPRAKVQGREGGEREARTHKEVNGKGRQKFIAASSRRILMRTRPK